jgi:hypothetical protein
MGLMGKVWLWLTFKYVVRRWEEEEDDDDDDDDDKFTTELYRGIS